MRESEEGGKIELKREEESEVGKEYRDKNFFLFPIKTIKITGKERKFPHKYDTSKTEQNVLNIYLLIFCG